MSDAQRDASVAIQLSVDGLPMEVFRASGSLLDALRGSAVEVPSLCFHPALGGDGRCGLCVVEVLSGDGWQPRLACQTSAEEGMVVRTNTPRVRHLRAHSASLLLDRGPFRTDAAGEVLRRCVAGDPSPSAWIAARGMDADCDGRAAVGGVAAGGVIAGCILCGLCVRACARTGKGLLTLLGRGYGTRVGMVTRDAAGMTCGSCRACQRVCPTGFINPDAEHTFTKGLYG